MSPAARAARRTARPRAAGSPRGAADDAVGFSVHLDNFSGPFDLLLSLIAKHELDITEVALSAVTDEFIASVRASGAGWNLNKTTEFLVVAATLLDLKAARLLPSGEVEDAEDLALLEARDLLFARLLQYRAYQSVAGLLAGILDAEARRSPRQVSLEPRFAALLPEVTLPLTPADLASLAAWALAPKPAPVLPVAHLHASNISVRGQASLLVDRLRRSGTASFRTLTGDAPDRLTVVARFLALLELFREGAVAFEQLTPLGELTVRWCGGGNDPTISDEFDLSVPGGTRNDGAKTEDAGNDGAAADTPSSSAAGDLVSFSRREQ